MSSDTAETHTNGLPRRAEVAMLTLRLRGLQHQAAQLEAEEGSDPGAALRQLEARISPLVHERRRALHAELERERVAAEQLVTDARRRALEMVRVGLSDANVGVDSRADAPTPQTPGMAADEPIQLLVTPLDMRPAGVDTLYGPVATTAGEPEVVAETVFASARVSHDESEIGLAQPDSSQPSNSFAAPPAGGAATALYGPPAQTTVFIDAETFATVFATVLAELLDSRLSKAAPQQPIIIQQASPAAATPAKKAGWAHALHADVLLMTLTMIVVLVVLAAWLV